MATRLHERVHDISEVELGGPPAVNSLFPRLPKDAIERLRAWSFFYDWDPAAQQVRWMTSFDTTEDDVERFAAGVRGRARLTRRTVTVGRRAGGRTGRYR